MAEVAEPLAYRPAEALQVFPVGRTALYELLRSGEIECFRVGRARFIPRQSLVDFMARQLADGQEATARAR
jgi:excisionase family DNA binding protein